MLKKSLVTLLGASNSLHPIIEGFLTGISMQLNETGVVLKGMNFINLK